MEIMTVSEVSKIFHVSTRMLRYYERIGLLSSRHREDYAYRLYDEGAVKRLQQILLLRKLRIPLKQISVILDDSGQSEALRILQESVAELDEELEALRTIRMILNTFVNRLDACMQSKVQLDLLEDHELTEIANALILPKLNLKEEHSMNVRSEANVRIEGKMDIRILYLPPLSVVSSRYLGENPEERSRERLAEFIREVDLPARKPDFRMFGFNNPSPQEGEEYYGYEFWASIPEHMTVPAPFEKKEFAGGLYAVHCIKMGDFHEWGLFFEQIKSSTEYEIDWREPIGMGGSLEEHLNAYSVYTGKMPDFAQIDLLIPVKLK